MATIRNLCIALLLTLCFAACACPCAAAQRQPTNRYISYAGMPHGRNDAGRSGTRRGCSALDKLCLQRQAGSMPPHRPPKPSATTLAAAVSQSQGRLALTDTHQTASTKGAAEALATVCKGGYITHAAMSRDKLCECDRFGCPNSEPPAGP